MEPNALKGARFLPAKRVYGPLKSPGYILQQPGLTVGLAATGVPGEQLVHPSWAQEMSGDMQTKMETFIVLFECWDKWLIISHFPNRFSFLTVLILLQTAKLRLKLNAMSLESQVCSLLCFPC